MKHPGKTRKKESYIVKHAKTTRMKKLSVIYMDTLEKEQKLVLLSIKCASELYTDNSCNCLYPSLSNKSNLI